MIDAKEASYAMTLTMWKWPKVEGSKEMEQSVGQVERYFETDFGEEMIEAAPWHPFLQPENGSPDFPVYSTQEEKEELNEWCEYKMKCDNLF